MNKQAPTSPSDFIIDEFTICPSRNLIIHNDKEVVITPKMLAVIIELARHPKQTLTKEHLMQSVWGTVATSDMVLSRAIADLRKIFGDSAKQQNCIETVIKQGYRLKKTVVWSETEFIQHKESTRIKAKPPSLISRYLNRASGLFLFVLLSAVAIYQLSDKNQPVSYGVAPKLSNLTEDSELERRVRFSPDGKHLIYEKNDPAKNSFRLVIHSLKDGLVTPLTPPDSQIMSSDISAVFSPTGKEVAFRRLSYKSCQIIIFSLIDRIERKLKDCPLARTHSLDWSPDGKYLVTNRFDSNKMIESLVLISLKTGQEKNLSSPEFQGSGYLFPRFSPSGDRVAVIFLRPNNNQWSIGIIEAANGKFSQALRSEEKINQVVWSQDGDSLFYIVDSSSRSGIWQLDLSTGKRVHLLNSNLLDMDFERASGQFAYIEDRKSVNIWRASLNGNNRGKAFRVTDPNYQNSQPKISFDGKRLAYISNRSGVDSLIVRNLTDNSERRFFKKEQSKLSHLIWSPDDQQLLLTVTDSRKSYLITINSDDGSITEKIDHAPISNGQWSEDGKSFYWTEKVNDKWQIYQSNEEKSEDSMIHDQPVGKFEVADDTLIYQKIGTHRVHFKAINNKAQGVEETFFTFEYDRVRSWDTVGNNFYYIDWSNQSRHFSLHRYNIHKKTSEELFELHAKIQSSRNSLSVSQDESQVYFTKNEKVQFDVILMSAQGN